jgi:hypothetical protein
MDTSAGFGKSELFLTDSRLVLGVLNHLRYQALNRAFGLSRDQANVVTAVLLLGAADGAYEAARRVSGMRLRVAAPDAALGAFALRGAALGVAGPSARAIPGFGTLVAFALLGGAAAPACGGRPRGRAPRNSDCAPPRCGCAASASGATWPPETAGERARRRPPPRRSRTGLARGCKPDSQKRVGTLARLRARQQDRRSVISRGVKPDERSV